MEPKVELRATLDDLTEFIHDLVPAARVELEPVIYEDEDANLTVYPPLLWDEEQCLDLQEKIGEYLSELLINTGYFILAYVLMPAHQVAAAEKRRQRAIETVEAADSVLAEAAALGLMNGQLHHVDPKSA